MMDETLKVALMATDVLGGAGPSTVSGRQR